MTNIEDIKKAIGNIDYCFYGIRVDECRYNVGDTANNSHQLYQDPEFDEDDNLIYPEGEGIYKGFYDAGELDGACCIAFDAENDESILKAINMVQAYYGEYITVIAGDDSSLGIDDGERIIEAAKVIGVFYK